MEAIIVYNTVGTFRKLLIDNKSTSKCVLVNGNRFSVSYSNADDCIHIRETQSGNHTYTEDFIKQLEQVSDSTKIIGFAKKSNKKKLIALDNKPNLAVKSILSLKLL